MCLNKVKPVPNLFHVPMLKTEELSLRDVKCLGNRFSFYEKKKRKKRQFCREQSEPIIKAVTIRKLH